MKHIDTQHLFIQREVNEGRLKLRKVKGEDNPADAGTKPLAEPRMKRLLEMVGIKFLVAAVIAARAAECAEAADVAVSGGVQVTVPETVAAAVTHLVGSGLGQILAILCVWEVVKALVARVLRQNKDTRSTMCKAESQRAATATVGARTRRKVLHTTGGCALLHKQKDCSMLKTRTRPVKEVGLCLVCDGAETDLEEDEAQKKEA